MPKANKFASALAKKEEPAAAAILREAPSTRRSAKHVGGYFTVVKMVDLSRTPIVSHS